VVSVLAVQAFNSFFCYGHGALQFLSATAFFVGIPLVPALVSLFTPNPLRAIGACLLFVPWLAFAYYVDCVAPYAGGGASMIYVAVFLWGGLSALAGALLTAPIARLAGLEITR